MFSDLLYAPNLGLANFFSQYIRAVIEQLLLISKGGVPNLGIVAGLQENQVP